MTSIWPYIALILLGCGWGLTIPLTVIAVKTGLGHLGIIFWQFFIVMVLFGVRQIFLKKKLSLARNSLQIFCLIAFIGTHTHVPTSDAMILPNGTAYQSDAGMCGSFNSVIGMDKTEPLRRFVTGMSKERFTPADGEGTVCGAIIETDDKSGLANSIEMLRLGGCLRST